MLVDMHEVRRAERCGLTVWQSILGIGLGILIGVKFGFPASAGVIVPKFRSARESLVSGAVT